ncbi:hypothetical protein ACKUB1_16295 [Methanospirillum stamsii]
MTRSFRRPFQIATLPPFLFLIIEQAPNDSEVLSLVDATIRL